MIDSKPDLEYKLTQIAILKFNRTRKSLLPRTLAPRASAVLHRFLRIGEKNPRQLAEFAARVLDFLTWWQLG
jgi:hypothetical protein